MTKPAAFAGNCGGISCEVPQPIPIAQQRAAEPESREGKDKSANTKTHSISR
jgi:hypothetical protein